MYIHIHIVGIHMFVFDGDKTYFSHTQPLRVLDAIQIVQLYRFDTIEGKSLPGIGYD